jgi:hypothetical protein
MGGRAIQAVTRQNSEPSWIAYVGFQFLLGPRDAGETPPAVGEAKPTPAPKQ